MKDINNMLSMPNGAKFYKCALQVNPAHYAKTYRGKDHGLSEDEYINKLIDKCVENQISVIGLADHNHVESVAAMQKVASDKGIFVFPGFEVSSSEGVHLICLFDNTVSVRKIERCLGSLNIHDTVPNTKTSTCSFQNILESICEDQNGIVIAAHATNENGLFRVLSGEPRINAWRDPNLLAIQIPGPISDTPDDVRPILMNQNPDYKRIPSVGEKQAIAVINASDVKEPGDLDSPGSWCWIKMSELSIEGLRQAFLDPISRIRLSNEEVPEEHSEIIAMSWKGGFLDGLGIHFNENLNTLIGGRGTGKSTVVESIRYIMNLPPLVEDAKIIHDSIIRDVLKNGTEITALVQSCRATNDRYLIQRTVPNPPIVMDHTGEILDVQPYEVLPGLEVYGQREISELTRNPDKLTRLLDRFKDGDDISLRKSELKRKLERSRRRIVEVFDERSHVSDQLSLLPKLELEMKSWKEKGIEEKLKDQSTLIREERVLKSINDRFEPFQDLLEQLSSEIPIDRAFLSDKALKDLPGGEIIREADYAFERFEKELIAIKTKLDAALKQLTTDIEAVNDKWGERKKTVQTAYEKILRELQKTKVDGQEFIKIKKQIEDLRPLKDRDKQLKRNEEELVIERKKLLKEWNDIKSEEVRSLEKAAKKVSRNLKDLVNVRITGLGNKEPLLELISTEVGGRLKETVEIIKGLDQISLTKLADACREGENKLSEEYGIPQNQAKRIVDCGPELFMKMEELDLPSTTAIELNVAPDNESPQWQTLDRLSTGQKATAVLLILLLESGAPLIVDQPEDDLDNRFITEGIVPKMREEKMRRQFIFASHNANIPVLGDAELIVGMQAVGDADEGKARIDSGNVGSIDMMQVRMLVEEILEGGKDAFVRRKMKYGF